MAKQPPEKESLVCQDCGHENEAERVYCHGCGVRLDRTAIAKDRKGVEPSPELAKKTKERVMRAQKGGSTVVRMISAFFKTVAISFVVACLFLMFRAPDGVGQAPAPTTGEAPMIQFDLQEALDAGQARTFPYTEDQVNEYLHSTIRVKSRGQTGNQIRFEGVTVQFLKADGGSCRFLMRYHLLGLPLYMAQVYAPMSESGDRVDPRFIGGSIGRLPLPAGLGHLTDFAFKQLWQVTTREQQLLAKVSAIQIGNRTVKVVTRAR